MAASVAGTFLLVVVFSILVPSSYAQLQVGFYEKTCSNAEAIIMDEITKVMAVAPSLSGPLLRMFFHDCFVRGCDGSVLLNTTDKNNPAEKDSPPNQTLRGYQIIDRVKARLEKECPEIVSCADVVALVARDVVHLSHGPHWEVPTGRRDGRISNSTEALNNLPPFFANITTLKDSFGGKGLSVKDLVVLSGGHTIGTAHCSSVDSRIYNFTGRGDSADVDPKLDSEYIPKLRTKCKHNDQVSRVEMDPGSFRTFDSDYYKLVSKRRGLFESDAALLADPETRAYVLRQSVAPAEEFFRDFAVSMVNMGNIEVLTGSQGEVRRHCAFVN